MPDFELPADAEAFFRAGRQLNVNPAKLKTEPVTLKNGNELKLRDFYVATYGTQFEGEDPHGGEGYYVIPAVPLVGKGGYDTYSILLWVPGEQQYAYYDVESSVLYRFPNTTWSDIEANPEPYLNAYAGYGEQFDFVDMKPWEKYPWIATDAAIAAMEAQRAE